MQETEDPGWLRASEKERFYKVHIAELACVKLENKQIFIFCWFEQSPPLI